MPEKRRFPLKNPPSEKDAVAVAPDKKTNTMTTTTEDRRKGGFKGGKEERGKVAEAIVKCQMCGREQKVVFGIGKAPEWHRCTWCRELQPMDGYRVIAYGRELPRVLAPHEVKSRADGLGY